MKFYTADLNPINRIRRFIGLIIFIFALILFIPGIALLMLSDTIYGGPVQGYPVELKYSVDGSQSVFNDNFTISNLKQGKNYDVKLVFTFEPIASDPPSSSIRIEIDAKSISGDALESHGGVELTGGRAFNRTTQAQKIDEYSKNLSQDTSLEYSMKFTDLNALKEIKLKYYVYENPNRSGARFFRNLGAIFVFSGIFVAIIAGIVSVNKRKERTINGIHAPKIRMDKNKIDLF